MPRNQAPLRAEVKQRQGLPTNRRRTRNNPELGKMAQIMQAYGCMSATVRPVKTVAQQIKDAVGLALSQGFPKPLAPTADQKRHLCSRCHMPCPCLAVFRQCYDRGRVDR